MLTFAFRQSAFESAHQFRYLKPSYREEQRGKTDGAESKCRTRSTLVEKTSKFPTLAQGIVIFTTQSSSVFNQLPRSRLERVFGRRSAGFSGVGADQRLEERRNMTIDPGSERKPILA